uniref:Uncharacterized protein n=1 Tax=Anopheles maculatus TaxID=74869 RepID=A0A182SP26_9DIPT
MCIKLNRDKVPAGKAENLTTHRFGRLVTINGVALPRSGQSLRAFGSPCRTQRKARRGPCPAFGSQVLKTYRCGDVAASANIFAGKRIKRTVPFPERGQILKAIGSSTAARLAEGRSAEWFTRRWQQQRGATVLAAGAETLALAYASSRHRTAHRGNAEGKPVARKLPTTCLRRRTLEYFGRNFSTLPLDRPLA